MCVLSHSHVWLFATPWTAAHQASLSMGILQVRILEWVVMHAHFQGIFPTWGSNQCLLHCLHWQVDSLPLCHLGIPYATLKKDGGSRIMRSGLCPQGNCNLLNPAASAGDVRDRDLIPGRGRSPGAGNGNPLQYSCLENPVDRGAWRATVHGVAKN